MVILNDTQRERYARHLILPEIGEAGQEQLREKSVLIVGAGGLGSPILLYLTAAGIGGITVVDFDRLTPSNLQRQVLYTEADLGKSKALIAKERLQALNSDVQITAVDTRFGRDNAQALAQGHHLLIDGTDNLATRYLLDDTARTLGIPYLYGAVSGFVGQCSLFHYKGAGGYCDLFPASDIDADNEPIGVASSTPGIIGSIMANEALKVLLGLPSALAGHLFYFDALTCSSQIIKITSP